MSEQDIKLNIKRIFLSGKNTEAVYEQAMAELNHKFPNGKFHPQFMQKLTLKIMRNLFENAEPKMKGNMLKDPKKAVILFSSMAIKMILNTIEANQHKLQEARQHQKPQIPIIPGINPAAQLQLQQHRFQQNWKMQQNQNIYQQQPYHVQQNQYQHQQQPNFHNPRINYNMQQNVYANNAGSSNMFPKSQNFPPTHPEPKFAIPLEELYAKPRKDKISIKVLKAEKEPELNEWWTTKRLQQEQETVKISQERDYRNFPWRLVTISSDKSNYIFPVEMVNVFQIALMEVDIPIKLSVVNSSNNVFIFSEQVEPGTEEKKHSLTIPIDIYDADELRAFLSDAMTKCSENFTYNLFLDSMSKSLKIKQTSRSGGKKGVLNLLFDESDKSCAMIIGFQNKKYIGETDYQGEKGCLLGTCKANVHLLLPDLCDNSPILTMQTIGIAERKRSRFNDHILWKGTNPQNVTDLQVRFVDDFGEDICIGTNPHALVIKYWFDTFYDPRTVSLQVENEKTSIEESESLENSISEEVDLSKTTSSISNLQYLEETLNNRKSEKKPDIGFKKVGFAFADQETASKLLKNAEPPLHDTIENNEISQSLNVFPQSLKQSQSTISPFFDPSLNSSHKEEHNKEIYTEKPSKEERKRLRHLRKLEQENKIQHISTENMKSTAKNMFENNNNEKVYNPQDDSRKEENSVYNFPVQESRNENFDFPVSFQPLFEEEKMNNSSENDVKVDTKKENEENMKNVNNSNMITMMNTFPVQFQKPNVSQTEQEKQINKLLSFRKQKKPTLDL